ncbi:Tautomerase/MIF superfamily [Lactarius pseudohatsudake]|nr:Tautomerase/MIF superfamily [Lactarius pseudohatsudake]
MPTLTVETNVKLSNPKEFVLNLSKLGADILKKPEKYISISYRYNEFLTFSGTFDPAFQLTVISLDNITPESTEAYSNSLFTFLKDTLGVPGDRGYIVFNDPGRAYIGHEGTTFAQIFGKE